MLTSLLLQTYHCTYYDQGELIRSISHYHLSQLYTQEVSSWIRPTLSLSLLVVVVVVVSLGCVLMMVVQMNSSTALRNVARVLAMSGGVLSRIVFITSHPHLVCARLLIVFVFRCSARGVQGGVLAVGPRSGLVCLFAMA